MHKKFLLIILTLLTALSFTGCGKSDSFEIKHNKSDDTSYYFCYTTSDSKMDENGNRSRTFYFINEENSFDLTYKVIKNFTMSDFYNGTSLITNDSYGYNRYMLVDTKGYELIPYDTYAKMERLGDTVYFAYTRYDREDAKYGIVDSANNIIVDDRYDHISRYPADDTIIFMCAKPEGMYDLRAENGTVIIEDVAISSEEDCLYYISPYADDNCGLLALQCDGKKIIVSEKTGEILVDYADYVGSSVIDFYRTSPSSGVNSICIFSNNGDKIYDLSDDYINCNVFALKEYRYVYTVDGVVSAICNAKGQITKEPEDGEIIYPIDSIDGRSILLELEDRYILKDSGNSEIAKFAKDEYTFFETTTFGFVMRKNNSYSLYDYKGKLLYENADNQDGYLIESEGIRLVIIGGKIFKIPNDNMILYTNDDLGICVSENVSSGKHYVHDYTGVISEFDSETWHTINDEHGIVLIQTDDGIYNRYGTFLYNDDSNLTE